MWVLRRGDTVPADSALTTGTHSSPITKVCRRLRPPRRSSGPSSHANAPSAVALATGPPASTAHAALLAQLGPYTRSRLLWFEPGSVTCFGVPRRAFPGGFPSGSGRCWTDTSCHEAGLFPFLPVGSVLRRSPRRTSSIYL